MPSQPSNSQAQAKPCTCHFDNGVCRAHPSLSPFQPVAEAKHSFRVFGLVVAW
jgi:hypothetical protein